MGLVGGKRQDNHSEELNDQGLHENNTRWRACLVARGLFELAAVRMEHRAVKVIERSVSSARNHGRL